VLSRPGLRGGVIGGGYELAGRICVRTGNQHAHAPDLQRRLLPTGIVRRHGRPHAVTAQHADDQLGLYAARHDRHRNARSLAGRFVRGPCHRDRLLWSVPAARPTRRDPGRYSRYVQIALLCT